MTPLSRPLRVGIAGTGFIAEFHANAIEAVQEIELVSVCDPNLRLADSFAARQRISEVFDSLESMLQSQNLDCVHILAPPDKHFTLAKTALESGVHVFVEKPLCTSLEEADELVAIARDKELYIGVNHNFLYSGAYRRLKEAVNSGTLGTLDYANFNYFLELGQIRSGPFDSWMLREPGNVIFEVGPHLISALLDLVGRPDQLTVAVDRGVNLPGGKRVFRRWRIRATISQVAVDININLSPCFNQRTMSIHGLWGSATADLDANTCLIDQITPLNFDLDRYHRSRSLAKQLNVQARETLTDYALSKFKLRSRGNPYQNSIIDSVAGFYSSLREGRALDERIDGVFGRDVIVWCKRIVEAAGIDRSSIPSRRHLKPKGSPTVLVLGGSGFIGRELIQQLLTAGYCVRAMVRNPGGQLEELENESLEVVRGDMRNMADLESAMRGVKFVYHLAVSEAKTWDDSIRNIVQPTRLVAEASLSAGIERLIYVGTIDSYYAGARAGTITELTPLDKNIKRRNYYARAKALSENDLKEMHRINGLPLVIFRPGIVIGRGGSPFHFGVGRFSARICEVWGQGNNKLPFVLVSDVASALVKSIESPGIEGKSFNLVDIPMLTAREYLEELQNRMELRLAVRYRSIWKFYVTDLSKWVIKLILRHPDRVRIPSYFDWESRTQKAIFDCTLARKELGWRPASDRERVIEEGIGEPLEAWLKAVR